MRRKILLGLAVLLLALAAFGWWWTRPLPVLTVTTWAGTYGRAQASSQILPYGAENRVNTRIAQWAGNLDDVRRAVFSGQHIGDVIDFELPAAVQACEENLLEPIDAASLPAGIDGTPANRDFYAGMVGRCYVASAIYGQMLVCRKPCGAFNLAGLFFAIARPRPDAPEEGSIVGGRIALQRSAKVNLEMALLADGVPPGQVYALLATPKGVDRAFAKLDTIKPNIVWWSGAKEPLALLRNGQVAVATALTGDVQAAMSEGNLILQKPQFYEADVLAIPRGTPKKEMALDYLRYATGSAPLAGMVRFAPFMPPRRSSLPLVEKLPPSPTRDFVLSQKGMLDKSFAVDSAWWHKHGAALEARFRAWMNA
jgi:putative spermidine/putrescine transport system substrate-binding protein